MATSQEDLDFMPDVHAAARRRGKGFAYILTLMTLAFLIIMGTWANYAVLDEVTRGEGRLRQPGMAADDRSGGHRSERSRMLH